MPVAACYCCDSRFCVETEADTRGPCPLCERPMTPTTTQEAVDHCHAHEDRPMEDHVLRLIANQAHQKSRLLLTKLSEYQPVVQQACERSWRVVSAVRESRERRRRGET
jgi:hypothetical protein